MAFKDSSPAASHASSDQESDVIPKGARRSSDLAAYDREILDEEDERENLLSTQRNIKPKRGLFRKKGDHDASLEKETKTQKRRRKRRRKETKRKEDSEMMFEMEEGGLKSDTSSQASSTSLDKHDIKLSRRPTSRRRRNFRHAIISLSILAFFILLVFGAYKMTRASHSPPAVTLLSNGTSTFAPTTIVISLDGFRADFLRRKITPTLNGFIEKGISPRWMLPSFPSVTFPNHYTLVTGLYPEAHGVVGNTFWDPEIQKEFFYTDPARSMQPFWWAQGEPLWVTAEKQNVKTAVHMWPGSEAGMAYTATYLDKYNGSETLSRKTDRILELLDLPSIETDTSNARPQLIAAYVPDVDARGHRFGPNSTEVWDTISNVDQMLHDVFKGLDERNLTEIVNVVVVSDHGMATTSTDRTIQLDDLIDLSLVEHIDGWPHYGLRPKDPVDIRGLYDRLSVEAERSAGFDVYLRDENMPKRYHFSQNERIAPLWVIPKTGWAIVQKDEFDVKEAKASGEEYHPKGIHGYDHEHPLMRAIFVARGPAFPHKPNSRVEVFQNIEVYNIICDSLGIEPKPNNGTLRLPLKPVGLHSDPSDPQKSEETTQEDGEDLDNAPSSSSDVDPDAENGSDNIDSWWAYMKAKMKAAMEWSGKAFAKLKGADPASDVTT